LTEEGRIKIAKEYVQAYYEGTYPRIQIDITEVAPFVARWYGPENPVLSSPPFGPLCYYSFAI